MDYIIQIYRFVESDGKLRKCNMFLFDQGQSIIMQETRGVFIHIELSSAGQASVNSSLLQNELVKHTLYHKWSAQSNNQALKHRLRNRKECNCSVVKYGQVWHHNFSGNLVR